mmetsp:Transcript_37852/g.95034  ORF Transcript_37852/g.95034 Transcript_37852/m.95034 type:complete len:259 (+) Transcript_37852:146-922(+)
MLPSCEATQNDFSSELKRRSRGTLSSPETPAISKPPLLAVQKATGSKLLPSAIKESGNCCRPTLRCSPARSQACNSAAPSLELRSSAMSLPVPGSKCRAGMSNLAVPGLSSNGTSKRGLTAAPATISSSRTRPTPRSGMTTTGIRSPSQPARTRHQDAPTPAETVWLANRVHLKTAPVIDLHGCPSKGKMVALELASPECHSARPTSVGSPSKQSAESDAFSRPTSKDLHKATVPAGSELRGMGAIWRGVEETFGMTT